MYKKIMSVMLCTTPLFGMQHVRNCVKSWVFMKECEELQKKRYHSRQEQEAGLKTLYALKQRVPLKSLPFNCFDKAQKELEGKIINGINDSMEQK